jgi:protein-S-isoprenylcysteine O-methyltransferase Ste14
VLKFDPEHLLTPEYLLTSGPYRYTQNPMHLGTMVIFVGMAVLLGSIPVALLSSVAVVGIPLAARLEQAGLARQFGEEWEQYAARTPRWLPRPGRGGAAPQSSRS